MNLRKDHYRARRGVVLPSTRTRRTPNTCPDSARYSVEVSRGTWPDRLHLADRGEPSGGWTPVLRSLSATVQRIASSSSTRSPRVTVFHTSGYPHTGTTVCLTSRQREPTHHTAGRRALSKNDTESQQRYNSERWITRLVCR